MKRIILTIVLLSIAFVAVFGQNRELKTVQLVNGREVVGYVTASPDGATYNVETESGDVFQFGVTEVKSIKNLGAIENKMIASSTGKIERKGAYLRFVESGETVSETDFSNAKMWELYKKGSSQLKTSNFCFAAAGVGVGLAATDLILVLSGSWSNDVSVGVAGAAFWLVAGGLTAGFLLRGAGKGKLETIMKQHNGTSPVAATVSFGIQPNGVGLALRF